MFLSEFWKPGRWRRGNGALPNLDVRRKSAPLFSSQEAPKEDQRRKSAPILSSLDFPDFSRIFRRFRQKTRSVG